MVQLGCTVGSRGMECSERKLQLRHLKSVLMHSALQG